MDKSAGAESTSKILTKILESMNAVADRIYEFLEAENKKAAQSRTSNVERKSYTDEDMKNEFRKFIEAVAADYKTWTMYDIGNDLKLSDKIYGMIPRFSKLFNPAYKTIISSGITSDNVTRVCVAEMNQILSGFEHQEIEYIEKDKRTKIFSLIIHEFLDCFHDNSGSMDASTRGKILEYFRGLKSRLIAMGQTNIAQISNKESKAFQEFYSSFSVNVSHLVLYGLFRDFCQREIRGENNFVLIFGILLRMWLLQPIKDKFMHELTSNPSRYSLYEKIGQIERLCRDIYADLNFDQQNDITVIQEKRVQFGDRYSKLKTEVTASGISLEVFEVLFVSEFSISNLNQFSFALMHGPMALESI
jgi:hypothetical protein